MSSDFHAQHPLPAQPGMYEEGWFFWLVGLGVFIWGWWCLFFFLWRGGIKRSAGKANSASTPFSWVGWKALAEKGALFKKKGKVKRKIAIQFGQPLHSFSVSQVVLGHSSCLMDSCGRLWGIPAGKRECFSPLIFSGLAWASRGEPHHLPTKKMPLQDVRQPSTRSQRSWGSYSALPWGFFLYFLNYSSFFHSECYSFAFRFSGQEGARINTKGMCDRSQGWRGPCELSSRSSAGERLERLLPTLQQPPPGPALSTSTPQVQRFSPGRHPPKAFRTFQAWRQEKGQAWGMTLSAELAGRSRGERGKLSCLMEQSFQLQTKTRLSAICSSGGRLLQVFVLMLLDKEQTQNF